MNRELLYRTVLRGSQESNMCCDYDTSPMGFSSMSPVTSLAHTLSGATLLNSGTTPRKRLSLSSTATVTPQSLSFINSIHSDSSQSDCENLSMSESPILISPRRTSPSSSDKENQTPYFSPSHSLCSYARRHNKSSPLRVIQATASRNLTFSPLKKFLSPSKTEQLSPVKKASPMAECDSSSRDSGYSESVHKHDRFSQPRPCAPTRKLNLDQSPPKVTLPKSRSYERKIRSFASLSKGADVDANLMELLVFSAKDDEEQEDCNDGSSSFSSLFSAPIQNQQPKSIPSPVTPISSNKLPIRRCLSMCDASTPLSSRISTIDHSIDETDSFALSTASVTTASPTISFKRPQPPSDSPSMSDSKRRRTGKSPFKSNECSSINKDKKSPRCIITQRHFSNPENIANLERPRLQRHHSESHISIMKALNKSSEHSGELTGDFSSTHVLPLIEGGKHPDLKSIDVHTMADLIRGEYDDQVHYSIIDCRYPYEYEGGHIAKAINFYHPQMVLEHLNKVKGPPEIPEKESKKEILIFHCEFSAERGPKAQRLLRETDRWTNKDYYPALHFPETYLLEGGYKVFYDAYPELCTPVEYVKMLDDNHTVDFRHFRSKSKSWASETKFHKGRMTIARTSAKRLGL